MINQHDKMVQRIMEINAILRDVGAKFKFPLNKY